jgi:glycerophosphoryl diester phosphodiesterase
MATPDVHAHRAGPLVEGVPRFVEQTLPAFAHTWRMRPGSLCELDVRLTRDREPVCHHDATLKRIAGREQRVDAVDVAAFKATRGIVIGAGRRKARAPEPVALATLAEVLDLARASGGRLNVELKNLPNDSGFDPTRAFATRVAGVLRESGLGPEQLWVQSFWEGDLDVLADELPDIPRSLLLRPAAALHGPHRAVRHRCDAVGLAWPVGPWRTGAWRVHGARRLGLEVMAYTVNDPATIRAAAHAGVDAVITDDPALAHRALAPAMALAA